MLYSRVSWCRICFFSNSISISHFAEDFVWYLVKGTGGCDYSIEGLYKQVRIWADSMENDGPNGKEYQWVDNDNEFMPLKEAVMATLSTPLSSSEIEKLVKKMGKKLMPNGPIPYMRKGRRCKVHMATFKKYMDQLKQNTQHVTPSKIRADDIPPEVLFDALDKYEMDIELEKKQIRHQDTRE